MRTLKCGGSEGGGEGGGEEGDEGGKVQGWDAPRVDYGSGHKHQQSVVDVGVTHVHEGDAPRVVTRSGRAWARSLSCEPSGTERCLK